MSNGCPRAAGLLAKGLDKRFHVDQVDGAVRVHVGAVDFTIGELLFVFGRVEQGEDERLDVAQVEAAVAVDVALLVYGAEGGYPCSSAIVDRELVMGPE